MTEQNEHNLAIALLRKGLTKAVLTAALTSLPDNILIVEGNKGQMIRSTITHKGDIGIADLPELTGRILTYLRMRLHKSQLSNPILLYRTVQIHTEYSSADACMCTTITFATLAVTAG